jgi:3-oxoacyl-[acyl-carrier-protein] synthase II
MGEAHQDLYDHRGRPRVAITGVGLITPHGRGLAAGWEGVLSCRSAVGRVQRFDPSGFPVTFAAEVADPGFTAVPAEVEPLLGDLKGRLAAACLREALDMAQLPALGARAGVCMGSEAARPDLRDVAVRLRQGIYPPLSELDRMAPHAPTRIAAAMSGATGPCSTVSTACTSSSQAVGEGVLRLRRGEVDAMVVGGVDVLVDPLMITGFALLGALSTRNDAPEAASRPFDAGRDGFVLGEGAGMLVIETFAHARARGAPILGEVSGFGCSCNAYRITDSPPDGRGAWQSMRLALADAGLHAEDIGYVNAHGTSTPMNDASETRGIQRCFGDHTMRVPVSSTKSMTGHLVAACGAVEAIFCLMAARTGLLPPTINLDDPDPECALDHVAHRPREARVRHAMTNAFGFGGSNGTLVVSAP